MPGITDIDLRQTRFDQDVFAETLEHGVDRLLEAGRLEDVFTVSDRAARSCDPE